MNQEPTQIPDKRLNSAFIRFNRFSTSAGATRINRINPYKVYPVSGRRIAGAF